VNFAIVTRSIIVINFVVFGLELKGGSAFDHYDIVSEMDLTDRASRIGQGRCGSSEVAREQSRQPPATSQVT